jgi:hypothetical protein
VKMLAEALVVVAEDEMERFRRQKAAQESKIEAMRSRQRIVARNQDGRAGAKGPLLSLPIADQGWPSAAMTFSSDSGRPLYFGSASDGAAAITIIEARTALRMTARLGKAYLSIFV